MAQEEAAATVVNRGGDFVVISHMIVNAIISTAGRCPAAAGGARKLKNCEKRKNYIFLIVFGRSSRRDFYGLFTKGVRKREGTEVSVALFEAFARRFIRFGESDVRPRHFQAGRIEGPGRG